MLSIALIMASIARLLTTSFFATAYDYVEVRRDFLAWTPAQQHQNANGGGLIPTHGIEEHQNMMASTTSNNARSRGSGEAEKRLPRGSSDQSQ